MIYNYEYNGSKCSRMKHIVYLITNTASNKYYVGQTRRELKKRWANYGVDLLKPIVVKSRVGCNIHLRRSVQKEYKKQGDTNFLMFSVLEIIDQENTLNDTEKQALLNEKEIYWIEKYRNDKGVKNVYNIKDGGQTPKTVFSKTPDDTRIKQSIARRKFLNTEAGKLSIAETSKRLKGRKSHLKGKTLPEEHCEKIRLAMEGTNNPNYGKHRSDETKKKIGDKNRQAYGQISEETRLARNEARKGKIPFNKGKQWTELYDEETVERMKAAVSKSSKERVVSEATKLKQSSNNKGRKWGNHTEEQKQSWSDKRKNVSYEERYGKEKANEVKEKLRKATKAKFTKTYNLDRSPLISPSGEVYTVIVGLYDFAKIHKLHPQLLKNLLSGKRETYKDWRLQPTTV